MLSLLGGGDSLGEPRDAARICPARADDRQPFPGTLSFPLYRPDGRLYGWQVGPVLVRALEHLVQEDAGS